MTAFWYEPDPAAMLPGPFFSVGLATGSAWRLVLEYVAATLEANRPGHPSEGPPLWPLAIYPHVGKRS